MGQIIQTRKILLTKIRSAVRNFVPEFVERNATIRYSKINEDSFMLGGYYYTLKHYVNGEIYLNLFGLRKHYRDISYIKVK